MTSNIINNIKKLKNIKKDVITYISSLSIIEIEEIIIYSADKYYNTKTAIISDNLYDMLIDVLKIKNPKSSILKNIGSHNVKNKVILDYWLGSMNKIKPIIDNTKFSTWIDKYKPPYNISDKLDGVSALLIYNNNKIRMVTRGDGCIGMDITHLIKYLSNIPDYNIILEYCNKNKIKGDKNLISFRGEIVIKKDIFIKKWNNKFKDCRSLVTSIINSKKINIELIKDIDLVLYEIIDPNFTIEKQFKIIKSSNNFNLVYNNTYTNILNFDFLSNYLKDRKINSIYQIDGIIITTTQKYVRNIEDNPDYAFAYKDILEEQIGITKVDYIEWNISKDGYLIPTLILKPVIINGIKITRTTGFNAKYIIDNVLGPGSEIEIIRSGDVIPYIKKIIKKAKTPQLPNIKWHWSESQVDIILDDLENNDDIQIKNIYHFFSILKIKGLGEKNIAKLYNGGFNTVQKILSAKKNDLINIENFGNKSVDNLIISLKEKLNNINLYKLMVASNKLGHGLGNIKIKEIINIYPNILLDYMKWSNDTFINNIKILNGWNIKTAKLFVNNFPKFIKFYNSIKQYINLKVIKQLDNNGIFKNKIIIFSGFRNDELVQKLEKLGAKIVNTISKSVTYLIIKNKELLNNPTEKIMKAQKYNIKIISYDELLEMLKN